MKNEIENNHCFQYQPLISAAIDGELEPGEVTLLETHLDDCERCRHEYRQFERVNDWLVTHDQPDVCQKVELLEPVLLNKSLAKTQLQTSFRSPKSAAAPTARTLLAGGALAAAGLAAVLLTTPSEPTLPPVEIGDVVSPLHRLAVLNDQSHKDQDSMTDAMSMELRTLLLETRAMDSEQDELQRLNNKIESLQRRLGELERNPVSHSE
ncbi:MAG: anti-sigma factor family protein [Pirellulaceae bacterium]